MMDTKEFEKQYNGFQNAKKQGVSLTKWFMVCCAVIVVAVLIWAFFVHVSTVNKIIVTDESGKQLNSEVVQREKMLETLVLNQCEAAVYYVNSFDRLNIKANQARSLFYINSSDAKRIFETYQKNGGYNDALQLGYTYEAEFERIIRMDDETFPYSVEFSAILTIDELDEIKRFRIVARGNIDTRTPNYPENKTGFFFTDYSQIYKRLENE